jgi:hypothetical protein
MGFKAGGGSELAIHRLECYYRGSQARKSTQTTKWYNPAELFDLYLLFGNSLESSMTSSTIP